MIFKGRQATHLSLLMTKRHWKHSLINFILNKEQYVLLTILVISVALFFCALNLKFDSSIDVWFLEHDPNIIEYNEFLSRFDSDEIVVMGVFSDDVFDPKTLSSIDRITEKAEEAPFAHRVLSLTNIRVAQGADDWVAIDKLIKDIPETKKQIEALRHEALSNELLKGLLAPDSKSTAIIVELEAEGNSFEGKMALTEALRSIAQEEKDVIEVLFTGSPPIDEAFFLYSKKDMRVLLPIVALMILLVLLIIFRRVSSALIPFLIVVLSGIWLLGIMSLFGSKINILTSGVFAVVLANGVADCIHIISDYYQQLMQGKGQRESIVDCFAILFTPCYLTTITTMAGMLSLSISNLQPIREFGWLAALGVAIAFVLSIVMIPVLLSFTKPPDKKFLNRLHSSLMARTLVFLGRPRFKTSVLIIGVALVLTVLSSVALFNLEVKANVFNYFRDDDPIRLETIRIEDSIGGAAAVEFVIETEGEGLNNPELLVRIDRFQEWLKTLDAVTYTVSVVDEIKELNRVFHDGKKEFYRIPDTRKEVAQFMLVLAAEEDFDQLVQDGNSLGRMSMRVRFKDSDKLVKIVPLIESRLKTELGKDNKVYFTGFVKLMRDMEEYLISSQIKSICLALLVILLLIGFLFRSKRLALFAIIPNVLPILFGIAFMSSIGIGLSPGTVMIGSIAIGLVVDDTIHFMVRLKRHVIQHNTIEEAIKQTLYETGSPIIVTSIVLSLGFLVMTLGSFSPNVNFGLISCFVILMALVADLIFLPAALMVIKPNMEKLK